MYYRPKVSYIVTILCGIAALAAFTVSTLHLDSRPIPNESIAPTTSQNAPTKAVVALNELEVKGRAPKTYYSRDQFGSGWTSVRGCDTRNVILQRDLTAIVKNEKCQVITGILNDPYTGKAIEFQRGSDTSDAVQIDHVVPLSDAWQKGAQLMSPERREAFANDPLELLAVDGAANQQKSDSDAATWLPPNKAYRCTYVIRQIAVKKKYALWVTDAEKAAIAAVLTTCPDISLPE